MAGARWLNKRGLIGLALGAVLLALGARAMAVPAHPAPPPGTTEVLAHAPDGTPSLARVALPHGLPDWAEDRLRLGGTWSYLIRDGAGVAVFDCGPRFGLAWSLLPWPGPKGLGGRLENDARIVAAVEALFPGRPITQIVLSHWHADHTEEAPALQAEAAVRWDHMPLLRIAAADRPARAFHVSGPARWLPAGAEAVFRGAGYVEGAWHWGPDLSEGSPIGQTGFEVVMMPGHTLGTLALVDRQRRLALGPSIVEAGGPGWTEDTAHYHAARVRFFAMTAGYRLYSTHPGRPGREL